MRLQGFDISGKNAVVTGGSMGLGYAMTGGLLDTGATVLISGRTLSSLQEAAARLEREHDAKGRVLVETVDLYDPQDVDAFSKKVLERTGGVDIFIGNAGAVHAEQIGQITRDTAERALQLNLLSNIFLVQAFLPHMRAKKWGRIIFSSSTASLLCAPLQGNIVYAASKSGINAFTRSIAGDIGRDGVTLNSLIIGVFWTSILEGVVADMKSQGAGDAADQMVRNFEIMTAAGRLGNPKELCGIVQLLASDAGSYMTGLTIPVDGGASIMMGPHPLG
ncbi:MAG: SDR family oxidoreductase [Caulobacterales bacterium]